MCIYIYIYICVYCPEAMVRALGTFAARPFAASILVIILVVMIIQRLVVIMVIIIVVMKVAIAMIILIAIITVMVIGPRGTYLDAHIIHSCHILPFQPIL